MGLHGACSYSCSLLALCIIYFRAVCLSTTWWACLGFLGTCVESSVMCYLRAVCLSTTRWASCYFVGTSVESSVMCCFRAVSVQQGGLAWAFLVLLQSANVVHYFRAVCPSTRQACCYSCSLLVLCVISGLSVPVQGGLAVTPVESTVVHCLRAAFHYCAQQGRLRSCGLLPQL